MRNIDWGALRTVEGSQHTAFEELCCQLAACEPLQTDSTFLRVGAPDAGVECYWVLPNEDESVWQAKFFLTPPSDKQWEEVDDSVKTALNKHPRLTSYTVCFPLDRQDPRIESQQWFMNKWNKHVQKWKKWAQEKGMVVEFPYWGQHEILLRLSREEQKGRFFFWFNAELFSDHWFRSRLDEAIVNVGARYTPELHVELPIAHLFDGLGRTVAFFERFNGYITQVKKAYQDVVRYKQDSSLQEYHALEQYMHEIYRRSDIDSKNVLLIEWERLREITSAAYALVRTRVDSLEPVIREREQVTRDKEDTQQQDRRLRYEVHDLRELMKELAVLEEIVQGDEAQLANVAALLLVGDAGKGKTHLFCDVAQQRLVEKRPTVLFLGEQFRDSEPWTQMRGLLDLSCDREQFLGALNASAEVRGQRALIFIDALNEGEGKHFWINFLSGMLSILSRYPWLGIALSVRSSYEEVVVPADLVPTKLLRVIHYGFAEHEYEATKTFFDYYGIERPSIPLLVPEFQNPLFLKLFCQGLRAGNYTRIPEGLQGITTIFNFFLDNLNSKLVTLHHLDLNPKIHYVRKAVNALTHVLAEKGTFWLPHEEAQTIVDQLAPPKSYENSLFRRLIAEGVLAEDRFLVSSDKSSGRQYEDGIRFAYERLSDHLIVQYLLSKYLHEHHPQEAFMPSKPLGKLVADERACWRNRGLVEALSIQLPECIDKELCELLPLRADDEVIREAFVDSLLWRTPASITGETLRLANAHALQYRGTYVQFTNMLLTVATNPYHPYNADFLHANLMRQSMAKRDASWSIFLHEHFDDGAASPINRLVDWAWKTEDIGHISDDSLRLAATALCWFLTTSHRFLRDRATKALVKLLGSRLHLLSQLLAIFAEVNDPYVSERLYAIAYGCAMRCTDSVLLREMAQDVYDRIFSNGQPASNTLLRDHARGIIERTLSLGLDITGQPEKIRPPYANTWPTDIPSKAEVDKLGESYEGMPLKERGRMEIYTSMMGWGDFARYVIGTNAASYKWSSRRLGEPVNASYKVQYEQFIASLTNRQKQIVERYVAARMSDNQQQLIRTLAMSLDDEYLEEEGEQDSEVLERQVHKMLGKKKTALFEQHVLSYLEHPDMYDDRLDLTLIQRWIFKRVFDLGWTVDRFGEFDYIVNRMQNSKGGRSPDKPERFGKKYQWIAYYDILARATDTFEFKDDYWDDEERAYEGTWQIDPIRNLDPSFLLERTCADHGLKQTNNWWFLPSPEWDKIPDDAQWLQQNDTVPDPRLLLEVTRPSDQSTWLTLQAHYVWRQPLQAEQERHGPQGREIWYFLESCLVKKAERRKVFAWAKQHNFVEDHLPEPREWHNTYFGELYWSPCYLSHYAPSQSDTVWTRGNHENIPAPIISTTETYFWTREYDCSIEESLSCYVPSKYIVDNMKLVWNGIEGHYFNAAGELVVFDPSMNDAGPSALLVQKDAFVRFLQDNDLAVLWTVRGEQCAYGNGGGPDSSSGRVPITGAFTLTDEANLQGDIRFLAAAGEERENEKKENP